MADIVLVHQNILNSVNHVLYVRMSISILLFC